MTVRLRFAIIIFLTVVICECALAQEKAKIFLGASSKTLGYSPLWVALKKGIFEQQGLDVQLVLLRGVPMTVQALAANSLHFGSGGPEPYIEASERGLDFIVTGGIINGIAQFLVAGKNYKTYEDLRGATFGTASLTGGIVTAARTLKEGLSTRAITKLIVAGGRRRIWRRCRRGESPQRPWQRRLITLPKSWGSMSAVATASHFRPTPSSRAGDGRRRIARSWCVL
jgi:hypothetical protein